MQRAFPETSSCVDFLREVLGEISVIDSLLVTLGPSRDVARLSPSAEDYARRCLLSFLDASVWLGGAFGHAYATEHRQNGTRFHVLFPRIRVRPKKWRSDWKGTLDMWLIEREPDEST